MANPPDLADSLILPYRDTGPEGRSTSNPQIQPVNNATEVGPWALVPWRAIIAAIGLVISAALSLLLLYRASRIVILVVVAGFFAVVLGRPVDWLQRRFTIRRGSSIALIIGAALLTVCGMTALFVLPVRSQLVTILTDLPGTVQQAAEGRGPVGRMVKQLHLESLVRENQTTLTRTAKSVQDSLPSMLGSAIRASVSVVTVTLMTCLMLSQSGSIGRASIRVVPIRHREWVRRVGVDAGKAVSGYMIGNLLISLCAGVASFACLLVLGVRNPVVIALWVAVADLIPLVGATIGAVVAVFAAFLVSPTAGIIALVFFILYQQFENSVLQIQIMARTVAVNQLVVLLSVLVGVELFGILGALLAVPFAGALSVLVKELWRHRPSSQDELIVVTRGDPPGGTPPKAPWYRFGKRSPRPARQNNAMFDTRGR